MIIRQSFITALILYHLLLFECNAQPSRIIVLGDIHYDLPEDHDMEWLKSKPDDIRQIKEYTANTANNWNDFMKVITATTTTNMTGSVIIQLGDLSEGLAGNPEKAVQMASHAMHAIANARTGVPWIIVKGNHDITGPGAPQAFIDFYLPMIRKQTGNNEIKSANYSYSYGNVQITCLDPWDKSIDFVGFLDKELSGSKAVVKLVAIHEPIIPVSERCWHVLRNEPERRQKLLEVIAKQKAIILCGHLHKYSVVSRSTSYGPVIQVMATSVVSERNYIFPQKVITLYGSSLVDDVPEWEPSTANQRKAWLAEESKFVTYYKQTELPGYAVINVDSSGKKVTMEYYAAFGRKPFDIVNLSDLMK